MSDAEQRVKELNDRIGHLQRKGAFGEALTAACIVVPLAQTELGSSHPLTARSLGSVGALLRATGDYSGARAYLEQSLELRRRILGNKHPNTATSLNHLGGLLLDRGDYSGARDYLEQALEIRRQSLGDDHPSTATSLSDLGMFFLATGDYEEARPRHEKALEIYRKVLGSNHPRTAISHNNLGVLLFCVKDYAGARLNYEKALEIYRKVLGDYHPHTAACLNNLAILLISDGRVNDSWTLIREAATGHDRLLGQVFSAASERQRAAVVESLRGELDILLSLTLRHLGNSSSAVESALDFVLRRKALGAEGLVTQRDAALSERYPQLEPTLRELSTLRAQIARHTLAGPEQTDRDAHNQTITELTTRRDRLEVDLAQQIPEMNLERKLRAADRRAVALALDAGVALVEFVRFDEFDFHAVPSRGEPRWKPARYLAFVLRAGEPDAVRVIDLGEADPIDRMIADFRASVAFPPDDAERDDTRNMVRRGDRQPRAARGAELRAAVFDPLVAALEGRTRLLLSPDGQLSRLPFAILPTADGRLLADEYQTSYVGTGRDVLRFGAVVASRSEAAFVVCDPDFDLGSVNDPVENHPEVSVGRTSRDMHAGLNGVKRLPGTLAEGRTVGELLGVAPWHGNQAVKKLFLGACRSPRVLHLATHGFFLKDQDTNLDRELWGRLLDASGQLRADVGENPLLRSGLALAGANTFLRGGVPPEDADNGLLTALDVTGMDLLGTELVVLSACQTGEGDVQVGEGVLGLQRAFTIAGAKTLVMSLWSVDDEPTRVLMVGFYRRLLAGEGKADALRHAQDELRARPEYADPYFWGAFVCQGDPGPLRAPASVATG